MVNLDYLYNPGAAKPHFSRNYFSDKKLGFQVIENGTILPFKFENRVQGWSWENFLGGIVDSQGEFIKSSSVAPGTGGMYTPPQNQLSTVLRLSFISAVYFFLFGDTLSRIILDALGS